jgi:hypothetical protein
VLLSLLRVRLLNDGSECRGLPDDEEMLLLGDRKSDLSRLFLSLKKHAEEGSAPLSLIQIIRLAVTPALLTASSFPATPSTSK